ncbi:MAG: hypothetical protein HN904_09135 [Victivallales bacterium]|jgi:hypothetical protein|nr:hypothetical protein [Victivallales bacterium]MBT7162930.1 hypothetical protein [Victivallales bacterium]
MSSDPVVSEVRAQRASILESYDWDFERMSRDAMHRQWESGHKVVSRPKRELEAGMAPNALALRDRA